MADASSSFTNSDFKRSDSGFSFVGKLAELSRNRDWVDGYDAIVDSRIERNGYSNLWEALSSGTESVGNELYTSIRNYIDNIGNIDVCGLKALKNYANILQIDDDTININFEFPKEINELIEIFSVNSAYLFNKAYDGTNLISLQNSILNTETIENVIDSLKDRTKYKNLIRDTFYNTLYKFLNLTVGEISNNYSEINASDLIWKLNISKFTEKLWDDDVSSETDIYTLKSRLGVEKSFSEKIYVDDIIAGRRTLKDFDASHQEVLKAEIESRQRRYSSDTTMRYYFMRLYKVLEYFRFTTIAFRNSYNLEDYDISTSKYVISDKTEDSDSILKIYGSEYGIDTSIVMRVAEWLADYSLELCSIRNRMKKQCQKNIMTGTKKLMIDTIREYLLEKIDSDTWKNFKNTTLFKAGLNKNFDVSLVEYLDPTEYFNIYNDVDTVDKNTNNLNPQFWKDGYDDNGTMDSDKVLEFYNKLTESHDTFVKNSQSEAGSDEPNLYDFLSNLFEMGATENSVTDANATTTSYVAVEGTTTKEDETSEFSGDQLSALKKFSGDEEIGDTPYVNVKNEYHPSYQIHPFINAFEEYNYAYTGIMNLVNSFSTSLDESRGRLSERIDELGNTINFWLNWNEDFTGYSSNYEKGGNDNDKKFNQDSPFNFSALNSFLTNESFINTILDKTNEYYIDDSTGKFILTDDEIDNEVQRLKKFKSQISELTGKEIYRYGKDIYDNIYILYKDSGNRKNRDALGTMWIRIKNHPIAFPLFDFDQNQESFSSISCMNDTDNSKLVSLISNILVKFESDYGLNYKSGQSSKVVVDNLTVNVLSNTLSGINTVEDGKVVDFESPSEYSKYTLDDTNTNLTFVKTPSTVPTIGHRYTYFIDSVTNEIIPNGTVVTCTYGTSSSSITAESKPLTSESDDCFTAYFYNNKTCRFELNASNSFTFAKFTDTSDTDVETKYTYKVSYDGKQYDRACSMHTMTVCSMYSINGNTMEGTYDDSGNITLSNFGGSSSIVRGYASLSSLDIKQTVDGGLLYEDTSKYKFEFKDSLMQSASGVILDNIIENTGYIITAGGNNNFFFVHTGFEESGTEGTLSVLTSLEIYPLNKIGDTRTFSYSSDSYYRNPDATELSSSTVYYSTDDITFSEASGGFYNDSIKQFSPVGMEQFVFAPYTTITDVVTSKDRLDELCKTEEFSGYSGDVQTLEIEGVTCYYRLKSNVVSGMFVDSSVMTSEKTTNIIKLHGGFKLYSSEYDDTPISLSFYDVDSAKNIMTYSSTYASENQQKFFDFGITYDRRKIYLDFKTTDEDGYEDCGMIVASISNNSEYGNSDNVSFLRDSIKNIEYVDKLSCGQLLHAGDCSNKKALFSVFCSFDSDNVMDISLYVFEKSEINSYNYKTNIKYSPYNFGTSTNPEYSFNTVATDKRLYIAFTSNIPSDSSILSNTVNGVTAGSVGSAEFKNIKSYCGDSLITIISLDIEEIDNISITDDETRYIMQNGALGYFPQYSGLTGKNLMFTNTQLSSDDRFPFFAQFKPLSTDVESFSLVTNYKVNPVDNGNFGAFNVSRFIDTYDTDGIVRGFAFADNDDTCVYHVNLPYGSMTSKSIDGLSSIATREKAYDLSRYTIDYKNNVHVLAENIDYAASTEALSCTNDCTVLSKIDIPIWSGLTGHIKTTFTEFFDVSSHKFYAFHGDGYTISELKLVTRANDEVFFTGGVGNITDSAYVESSSTVGYHGECYYAGDNNCSYYYQNDSSDTITVVFYDSESQRLVYDIPSSAKNVKTFFIKDGGYEYPCALYTIDTVSESTTSTVAYMKRFDAVDYSDEDGNIVPLNSEKIFIVTFDDDNDGSDLNPNVLNYSNQICGGTYVGGYAHFMFGINSPADTVDDTDDDSDSHIATFKHIKSEIANCLFSLDVLLTKDINDWEVGISHHKDSLNGIVKYSESECVSSLVCENELYDVVSINSDGDYGAIGWIDKNVAYSGSVSEKSLICDYDGSSEYNPVNVGQPYCIGSTVICATDDGESIIVSNDYGKNFKRSEEARGSTKKLIGCSKEYFYALAIENGYVIYSPDGHIWKKALELGNSNWNVLTNGKKDIAACESHPDGYIDLDSTHYLDIVNQINVYGNYPYDEMFVEYDDETVVLVGGIDGQHPVEISVIKDMEVVQHSIFEHNVGIEYTSAYIFNGSVFLSPKNSTNVLRISNIGNTSLDLECHYIDIAQSICNEAVSYKGFEVINKSLIMYPETGKRILVYNTATDEFLNYYTSKSQLDIADSDKLGNYPSNELLFTLRESDGDGSINFIKSNFTGRDDYGIVEIDNGFPILVTYESVSTIMEEGGEPVNVYEFTFTMLNSDKKSSVSIITTPTGDVPEKFKKKYADRVLKSKSYTIGGESIVYTFATVDETTKYCIYKNYKSDTDDVVDEFLNITYNFNSSRRSGNLVTFNSSLSSFVSIYDGFDGFQPGDIEDFENIIGFSAKTELSSYKLSSFSNYSFTNTAEFSGSYGNLKPVDSVDEFVSDSNLMLMSPNTTLSSLSGMFEDCENGSFNTTLYLERRYNGLKRLDTNKVETKYVAGVSDISPTNAACMFKNCFAATIPSANISGSIITDMREMFYECNNAILAGVTIPSGTVDMKWAFRDCFVSKFESISSIPSTVTSISGAFYGCTNGTFENFTFN